jgi:chromosome segregation ATPase
VTIVGIIALLWRAPKPTPVPVSPIAPESLRSFVDTYERKANAMRELEILEQQVRKRKISRRRYKVRKKALDGRLSVFSKDLTELKEEMRKASSRYASTMRQIEVAETELEETEAAMRRIELRYRRREISKGTYRKLMDEYIRRKERAETTIDGVLLRLREEIR